MKMPFLLISPKIVPKIQLIKKGGCFEYHAVIADKIKYRYVHRASICPALGMDRRSFFMPKPMGKYKRLEVFYLSKPVYTADKPSDCHYCYFWTNGRKGCRLGRNNCYYLISLPPKPKSECDGCPYEEVMEKAEAVEAVNASLLDLAKQIDQFSDEYDHYEYADRVDDKKSNIVEIYHDLTNGNAAPYRDFLEQVIEDSDEISVVQAATQLKNELDKAVSRPKESVIDQLKQISGQTVPSKMSHSFKEPER